MPKISFLETSPSAQWLLSLEANSWRRRPLAQRLRHRLRLQRLRLRRLRLRRLRLRRLRLQRFRLRRFRLRRFRLRRFRLRLLSRSPSRPSRRRGNGSSSSARAVFVASELGSVSGSATGATPFFINKAACRGDSCVGSEEKTQNKICATKKMNDKDE